MAADSAGESRGEFRTGGMVFHTGGVRLRIGQDFARGIDDGDASTGGLSFLSGDICEGVAAVVFDAVGEKLGLLDKVALNLGAQ